MFLKIIKRQTTDKNIIKATSAMNNHLEYKDSKQITIGTLIGLKTMTLQPRVLKIR